MSELAIVDSLPLALLDCKTFADEEDRRRLTATATKAVVRLTSAWQVASADAARLLDIPVSSWHEIEAGEWDSVLSQDRLIRASALIGLFNGLHRVFADEMADRWPSLPNAGPLFGGQSPIAAMLAGGTPQIMETRHHIDALCSG